MMFRRILAAALAVFVFCAAGPVAQAQVIPAQSATVLAGAKKDLYPTAIMALDFAGVGTGGAPWYKAGGAISNQPSTLRGYTFSRALAAYAEDIEGKLTLFPAGSPRVTNKGVLIEEARTNVLLRSQEFDHASWGKTNGGTTVVVTADAMVAPDGATTADKLVENTTTTGPYDATQSIVAPNGTYTFSAYFKAAERGYAHIRFTDLTTGGATAVFNLSTGATTLYASGPGSWTNISAYAVAMPGGWFRAVVTATKGAGTSFGVAFGPHSGAASDSYAGVLGQGVYQWGAQVEAAAFATSYIPTTSTAVTRPADVFYYAGGTFPSTATIVATFQIPVVPATTYKTLVGGGVGLPSMSIGNGSSNVVSTSNRSVVSTASTTNTYNPAVVSSAASRASSGANAVALDGATVSTSAATYTMAASGSLGIGYDVVSANNQPNGYIQRILIYPFAMSDVQLQAATMPGETSALRLDFVRGTYKNAAGYVRTNYLYPTETPSAWASTSTSNGVTVSRVATGVEDGLAYADYRWSGTSTGVASDIRLGTTTYAAAPGQTWSAAYSAKIIAGSLPTGGVLKVALIELTSAGGYISETSPAWYPTLSSSAITRSFSTRTLGGTAGKVQLSAVLGFSSGVAVDVTIRVYAPQLEQTSYPTSFIPTTAAAASVNTYSSTNPADVGNMTFTRASTGYAEDTSGNLVLFGSNVPRITNKGVLIEPAATNLALNSSMATSWGFNANDTVTANAFAAPDGTLTATKVQLNSGITNNIYRQFGVTAGSTYTASFYVRRGSGAAYQALIAHGPSGSYRAWLNTTTGIVSGGAIAGVWTGGSAIATPAVDGWWRVAITVTVVTDTTLTIETDQAGAVGNYAAAPGDFFYCWGAQLEAGSIATSYIPTTSVAVTRAADMFYYTGLSVPASFSMAMSGIIPSVAPASYYHMAGADAGTGADAVLGYYHNGGASAAVDINSGGVTQANFNASGKTAGAVGAIAIRVSANAFGGSFDGGAAQQDAAGTAPSPTILRIGQGTTGTANHFRSYVQRVALYPYAANDNELPYRSAGNF